MDGKARASNNVCVAILHTPFQLLLLATVIMIGLVLVITPRHALENVLRTEARPCEHPAFFSGLGNPWPDQILPKFVIQW